MIRARFYANLDDYRSVAWPPSGPYWCSGYNDTHSVIVAYVKDEKDILKQWPEAIDIEAEEVNEIVFSERFPEPNWWQNNFDVYPDMEVPDDD